MPNDLLYDESGGIGTITLNRPEARNALTGRTYAELEAAIRTSSARCLVITGASPAFCSGDDVKQVMAADGPRLAAELRAAPRLTPAAQALLTTDIPVIAAVNGPAVGWGTELALMADVRIASTRGDSASSSSGAASAATSPGWRGWPGSWVASTRRSFSSPAA